MPLVDYLYTVYKCLLFRLVEDVAVLQTLEQSQRRKEIYSELTANMEQIFRFLLGLLEKHYGGYRATGSEEHCRVCMAILNTFSSLVEWVNIQHVMANEKYLLRYGCLSFLKISFMKNVTTSR